MAARHPYENRIRSCASQTPRVPQTISPTNPSKLFWLVETRKTLEEAMDHIVNFTEIGLDVEHHSEETYRGITCLIQISTDERDIVVDPLALGNDTRLLARVLENHHIVKIMHDSRNDLQWLQRDFRIFPVNVMDTLIGSRLLGDGPHSLMHLAQTYEGVFIEKALQTTDWRARPLTSSMLEYARNDTRYLLGIYRRMLLLLSMRDPSGLLLNQFAQQSAERSLEYLYTEKVHNNESSWKEGLSKARKKVPGVQINETRFRELYNRREEIARRADKSPGYVLPLRKLVSLCEPGGGSPAVVLASLKHSLLRIEDLS